MMKLAIFPRCWECTHRSAKVVNMSQNKAQEQNLHVHLNECRQAFEKIHSPS